MGQQRLCLAVPGLDALLRSDSSSRACAADIRSETKDPRERDPYKAGKKRAQDLKRGKSGKPSDDGYKDMDENQKAAYRKGYKDGQ